MINNLKLIKPLLSFDSPDDFYYLQILQRKKDMDAEMREKLGTNNNARSIKTYYINSIEYLESRMHEIIALCDACNARASIRLNKRSYEKVAFRTLTKIAGTLANGEFHHIRNSYTKACGTGHNDKSKKWIIDIDKDELIFKDDIINVINNMCDPIGEKIIVEIPTKTGIHLITSPFNRNYFTYYLDSELFSKYNFKNITIDIHRDNPTNLYIP